MNKPEIPMHQDIEGKDDLQKIKGIGKSIAQALNELGYVRFTDLAGSSAEKIMESLKGKVPSIGLQRANPEAWIQQARSLSGISQPNTAKPPVTQGEFSEVAERSTVSRLNWREIADFFVSFGYEVDGNGEEHMKTRAHHSQADQMMQWDGIASDELLEWLLEQAKLPLLSKPPVLDLEIEEGAILQAEKEEAVHFALSNLWVSEVKVPIPSNKLRKTALLRVKSDLTLSGPASEIFTEERREYAIDIYLVDTETKKSVLAGTELSQLEPGKLLYKIQHDIRIPDVGNYQLYQIARLLPPTVFVTHLQGPIIRVEA